MTIDLDTLYEAARASESTDVYSSCVVDTALLLLYASNVRHSMV